MVRLGEGMSRSPILRAFNFVLLIIGVLTAKCTRLSELYSVDFSSTRNVYALDVIIGVAIGVGAPCITICVIVVSLLIYKCHKNKHRLDHLTTYNSPTLTYVNDM